MADRYEITTILVSHNCLDSLRGSLRSLEAQVGVDQEIIVIDNASGDGTAGYLRQNQIPAIFSEINLGYGAAINLAAEKASGKYLFLLNPDTEFGPTILSELYRFAENARDIGLVSPMLRHPDGSPQVTSRKSPGRLDFFFGRGSPLFKLGLSDESAAGYIMPSGDDPMEVPAVTATALLVKREVFLAIGGFDPRFFLYLEDIDLCRRIEQSGRKIVLLPSVSVTHAWRGSSRKKPIFAIYHHHRSVWKYFRKYYPREWLYNLPLFVALCFGFVISSLLAVAGKKDEN